MLYPIGCMILITDDLTDHRGYFRFITWSFVKPSESARRLTMPLDGNPFDALKSASKLTNAIFSKDAFFFSREQFPEIPQPAAYLHLSAGFVLFT